MKIKLYFLFPAIAIAILFSCARPGSPGGGPKDKDAPVVLATFPENGSANFNTDKFTIEFDEFIKLEDVQKQALISPPLFKKPDFKIKGKSLQVKFNEELKANTTYSVYFGNAITDITEGNPVSNYTYIFSTGPLVDSLSLQGKVVDAFTLEPVEECFVMLYKDDNDTISLDSLPLFVRPYYLSKTNKQGKFRFNGLGDDEYLMFAILDMNASLSFDQPSEQIAFIDSLIRPSFVIKPKVDTSLVDSLKNLLADDVQEKIPDSLSNAILDSLSKEKNKFFSEQLETYNLFLYTEKDTVFKLSSAKIVKDNTIWFAFNMPVDDNLEISVLNYADREIWYVADTSKNADTINWYYKNLDFDTLEVLVKYNLDTLDILNFRLHKQKKGRLAKKEEPKPLNLSAIPKSKVLAPNTSPQIEFSQPIESISFDSVVLISGSDTILNPEYFFTDKLQMRLEIPIENKEDTRYLIIVPDSIIYDWNGLTNQETLLKFSTKPLNEYGNLFLSIALGMEQAMVLQLLNAKNEVVRQNLFSKDTTLAYKYLNPGKYKVKAIFDSNNNGKWDGGTYLKGLPAERVILFSKELEIRANWDIEEEWLLK